MKKHIVMTGTVTYAIKGRDLLRHAGFRAGIERVTSGKTPGCGYAIVLEGDLSSAEKILRDAGVKILGIREN
ncbi:MAG: DUF3343 domain-containing protein [Clostridia bacterium]|nr:DUF3343 domain-containing protein [Clostridia bacterium]